MMRQAENRFKVWLVLVGVFALGAITGGALDRAYWLFQSGEAHAGGRHHDRGRDERFLQDMQRELGLTPDQTQAVRQVIDETRKEYHALRAEVHPRYESVRERKQARIRALLTPAQQAQFDEMIQRRRQAHERREKREK